MVSVIRNGASISQLFEKDNRSYTVIAFLGSNTTCSDIAKRPYYSSDRVQAM